MGDRRRCGRVRCGRIRCSLGEVLDISASGVRVRGYGWLRCRQGRMLLLRLPDPGGDLALKARVVWRRRSGLIGFTAGLHFVEVSERQRQQIWRLVQAVHGSPKPLFYRPCDAT